ncbi:hypothetical protein DQM20_08760 [Lactiplantibacillus plantarum]|nr:hypothetical protein DQM20_08760 [Lactiplantibacillus plantarum]
MAWLVEDQYLRRGLRLKSVSTAFQQLAEMPGSRCRTNQPSMFTLIRTFSSGPKLVAFDLKLQPFNNISCRKGLVSCGYNFRASFCLVWEF